MLALQAQAADGHPLASLAHLDSPQMFRQIAQLVASYDAIRDQPVDARPTPHAVDVLQAGSDPLALLSDSIFRAVASFGARRFAAVVKSIAKEEEAAPIQHYLTSAGGRITAQNWVYWITGAWDLSWESFQATAGPPREIDLVAVLTQDERWSTHPTSPPDFDTIRARLGVFSAAAICGPVRWGLFLADYLASIRAALTAVQSEVILKRANTACKEAFDKQKPDAKAKAEGASTGAAKQKPTRGERRKRARDASVARQSQQQRPHPTQRTPTQAVVPQVYTSCLRCGSHPPSGQSPNPLCVRCRPVRSGAPRGGPHATAAPVAPPAAPIA
jgi:hypothetical protein